MVIRGLVSETRKRETALQRPIARRCFLPLILYRVLIRSYALEDNPPHE